MTRGGEGGIRTLEPLAGLPVFETSALDHYATSPWLSFIIHKKPLIIQLQHLKKSGLFYHMPKKILILYTSIGLGHKSIAENIGYYLTEAGYQVRLEDILKVQEGWLVNFGQNLHTLINTKLPWLWSYLYQSKIFTDITLPLRLRVAANNYQPTLKLIQVFHPDLIITTQTTASAIIAYLKKQKLYTSLFGIAFSDFHLHRYWLYDQADFYLANTTEQKQEMLLLNISPEKIYVCGIILRPKPIINLEEVRKKLSLPSTNKIILVTAGSLGRGFNTKILEALAANSGYSIIAVCGKNIKLYEQLSKKFTTSNVKILSFYSPMDELYAIADACVTKPGGLSTAEALRWNLPLQIAYMLPGQEELNYSHLLEKALVMTMTINLEKDVRQESERHDFKKSLAKNPATAKIASDPKVLLTAIKDVLQG